jgi:NADH:ubiquinone oxidoreductase subunit 2 (subunit N)
VGVVVQMYMRSPADAEQDEVEAAPISLSWPVAVTLAVAGIVTILLGLWPTPLWNLVSMGIFG